MHRFSRAQRPSVNRISFTIFALLAIENSFHASTRLSSVNIFFMIFHKFNFWWFNRVNRVRIIETKFLHWIIKGQRLSGFSQVAGVKLLSRKLMFTFIYAMCMCCNKSKARLIHCCVILRKQTCDFLMWDFETHSFSHSLFFPQFTFLLQKDGEEIWGEGKG